MVAQLSPKFVNFGLFVGIVILGVANASPRPLGAQKCTWGPSYWCSGIRQSSKCSATTHCISAVWNNNPYPEDGDDICQICKEMVKEARDQLLSNETQEELKEVFEGSCKLIPIQIIADECITLADEFIPELVETLASEMNPDTVCTVAGLCNSRRIDKLLTKYLRTRTNCDVCHEGAKKVLRWFRQVDKDDVLDKGLAMCGQYMSSYSDACKLSLLENFDDLYSAIYNLDDGICEVTQMCSEESKNTPALLSNGADLECQFCVKVMQHYVDMWSSNQTEEEFKQVLDSICRTLGQPERISRCLNIVDNYYIPFFDFLIHEIDSKTICRAVGLCGPSGFLQVKPDVPISMLLPFEYPRDLSMPSNVNSNFQSRRLIGGYFAPQTVVEMNKPGCAICEFVMHRLREWLQDGHTQDEIQEGLREICGLMPSSLKGQCTNLVDTEGPAIVQLIIQGIETTEICKLLQLCDQSQNQMLGVSLTSIEDGQNHAEVNPVVVTREKNDNCATCNYVVNIVLEEVRDKDNQDEIRNLIQSVCRALPSSIEARCDLLVGEYAEKFIDLIVQNLTPEEICIALDLCPDPKPKGQACMLCEFAITQLDKLLENKQSEAEIRKALETLCSYLPSKYEGQCDTLVDTYTDLIIELITKDLSPDEICEELGLCTDRIVSSIQNVLNAVLEDEDDIGGNTQTCMFCKFAIGELDKMIEDKQKEEQIKQGLEKLCAWLPRNYADQCKSFVDTYTDLIIDMIVKDYTPEEICLEVGLCEKKCDGMICEEKPYNLANDEMSSTGSSCELCEFAITKLDAMLVDKHNEQEIKDALGKLCDYMPMSITDECKTFVSTYTDTIIEMLTHDVTPKEICTELGLCNADVEIFEPSMMEDTFNVDSSEEDYIEEYSGEDDERERPYCMMCEYVVGEMDKFLTDNRTEEYIQETVEQICHLLSNPIRNECTEMVDRYTEQLITMLVAEYTPAEICAELGLCKKSLNQIIRIDENDIRSNDIPSYVDEENNSMESSEEEFSEDISEKNAIGYVVAKTPSCALCEFVMNMVENQILSNRTLDMVEHAVLMVCSYMPKTIAEKCEDYVQEYGDEIIKLIVEMEMDPDMICSALGLCTTSQKASSVGGHPNCIWGRDFWCQSIVHATACGTVDFCNRTNGWNRSDEGSNDINF